MRIPNADPSGSAPTARRLSSDRTTAILVLAAALVGVAYLVLGTTPEKWVDNPGMKASSRIWRLSTSLAIVAVVFLVATLLLGPIRVLRGGKAAVHLPLRRTLGITAAALAGGHVLVALNIHGSVLRPWSQFLTGRPTLEDPFVLRGGARGYANHLGLLAAIVLALVAALSRNSWLRRLGNVRWKMAQRSVYIAFAAIFVHAILYWQVERRLLPHQAIVAGPIAVTAFLQLVAGLTSTIRSRSLRRHIGEM